MPPRKPKTDGLDSGLILPPKAQRLVEESLAIEAQEAKEAGAVGFMARALVQATIPHRDPGDVRAWGRNNGDLSLVITPGYTIDKNNQPVCQGYPFGTVPRLVLAWLSTEAVRTQSPEITLGNSLSAFMRELRMDQTGGKNGSITRLQDQMKRLFSANIVINYSTADVWAKKDFQITDEATIWWNPMVPEQESIWQSKVHLSERFFKEIVEHPVPIDLRALSALRQSPLALDIYSWMTYRLFYLKRPTVIPWESLAKQFGSDYKEIRFFRRRFNEALKQVQTVYQFAIESETDGLKLFPGKPHVRKLAP